MTIQFATPYVRGRIIKFANPLPCACFGSTGQNPQYGLMTLIYQRFTAVLLLIYGSFFLSDIYVLLYYCLLVFWSAPARRSEFELEQRTNIKFLVKFGKSGNEMREMLLQVYGDSAMKKTAVYKWVKRFLREEKMSLMKRDQDGQQQAELKKTLQRFVKLCVKIVG